MSAFPGTGPALKTYPNTINYADGSEKRLLEIVSARSFSEDTSWRAYRDWATYYHLSPQRKNLLNWIDWGDTPLRILEIGAGCGAITSHLVAIPHAQVTAVEGSLDRAKVIAARCRAASNLQVHSCNISDFEKPNKQFEVVTLIGVLEYAGKYEEGDDPFMASLRRAHEYCTEDGVLVIAIENLLGHKYLAGCPEDHYGKPYEGINGYPHYNGVRTFSRQELGCLLTDAGFTNQEWFYPYPDYKLPAVVFSDEALVRKDFDWLAITDVPREPNHNKNPAFNEMAFMRSVGAMGVMSGFMNSFLTVAGKSERNRFSASPHNTATLAIKSNVKTRHVRFQTTTSFVRTDVNSIAVVRRRLNGGDLVVASGPDARHLIENAAEKYHAGFDNLYNRILQSVFEKDYSRAAASFAIWADLLAQNSRPSTPPDRDRFAVFCDRHFDRLLYAASGLNLWIDGKYLDLIPMNILVNPATGERSVIDLEWQVPFAIPAQLIFDRGLRLVSTKLHNIIHGMNIPLDPASGLPRDLHVMLNKIPLFHHVDCLSRTLLETWLQMGVINGNFDHPLDWKRILPQLNAAPGAGQLPANVIQLTFDQFCGRLVRLVERNENKAALEYFRSNKQSFMDRPEFGEVILLMEQIRKKV